MVFGANSVSVEVANLACAVKRETLFSENSSISFWSTVEQYGCEIAR